LGVKFIFIISLMHTLSDKVRFVQRKLKPEEEFTIKKWMVLAEHLLAQAHMQKGWDPDIPGVKNTKKNMFLMQNKPSHAIAQTPRVYYTCMQKS